MSITKQAENDRGDLNEKYVPVWKGLIWFKRNKNEKLFLHDKIENNFRLGGCWNSLADLADSGRGSLVGPHGPGVTVADTR